MKLYIPFQPYGPRSRTSAGGWFYLISLRINTHSINPNMVGPFPTKEDAARDAAARLFDVLFDEHGAYSYSGNWA